MKRILFVITTLMFLLCRCLNAQAQTQVVANGSSTTPVPGPGTGCLYNWTNSNTSVGLPASGVGDIPAFTAINTGTANAYATVTASPVITPLVFLPNTDKSQIEIYNTANNTLINTIQLGSQPHGMAFSPDRTKMYVTGNTRLYIVDLIAQKVIDSVAIGSFTNGLIVSPDGKRVYIGTGAIGAPAASVTIVNVSQKPYAIGHIYFNYDNNTYVSIAHKLALNADGTKLYVSLSLDSIIVPPINANNIVPVKGFVSVISTFDNSIIATIQQKKGPYGIALNNNGTKLYVANSESDKVTVVNTTTNTVIDSVTVNSGPRDLVLSPDGANLYVTNYVDGTLAIINTATNALQRANVSLATSRPAGISISSDGSKLYVASPLNATLIQVSTDFYNITKINTGRAIGADWFGNFITTLGSGCGAVAVNYVITPTPSTPTIVTGGTPAALATNAGTASAPASFTVTGYKLTQGILVTAPPGFEISTDKVTFSSSFTIGTGGDIPTTAVYVRIPASAAVGSYSGNIVLSSSPAANKSVPVSGSVSPVGTVVPNYTFYNGQKMPVIKFPGNGCYYSYTSDRPGGGALNGTQLFGGGTAQNAGTTPITTTYSVSLTPAPYNQTMAFIVNQLSGQIWYYDLYNTGGDLTNNFKPGSNGYLYTISSGGGLPQGIAFSSDPTSSNFTQAYITNKSGNNVSLLPLTIAGTGVYDIISYPPVNLDLGAGAAPVGIAMSPDGKTLYVANSGAGSVSVISVATFKVTATINSIGLNPSGLAISPDGSRVYVAIAGSGNVAVVNTADNSVLALVPAGANPQGVVVSTDGSKVYVTNPGSNTVSVINAANNTAGTPITVGSQAVAMGISPDGSKLYVANQASGTVSVISTAGNNVLTSVNIGAGKAPSGIGVSPDGALIYVYDFNSNVITMINAADNSIKGTFNEGGSGPAVLGNFIQGPSGCALPFTFSITVLPTPPSITASGYPAPLNTSQGVASAITSFNVAGISLTEGVLVTPPPGFEVSIDSLNFSPTIKVGTGGNMTPTRVYIRLSNTAPAGAYSGNIVLSSAGASNAAEPTAPSTVSPPVPVFLPGLLLGKILACTGTPSASPNIQHIKISTVAINGVITANATSPDFEISTSPGSNFAPTIGIPVSAATPDVIIYIRSSATAKGRIAANLRLTYPGAETTLVPIYGIAAIYPTIDPVASQTIVAGGAPSKPIVFSGTGANTYNWFNDNVNTGLAASGTGNIAPFVGQNTTNTDIVATVKAYPVSVPLSYIVNQGGDDVTVVNVATNTVIADIPVGSSPRAILLNEDATRAYISNNGTSDVSVLNTATNTIIATIKVGLGPVAMEFSPDGTKILVYNTDASTGVVIPTISTISTIDNTLISTTPVPPRSFPPGTLKSPDGTLAYVYDGNSYVYQVVDIATNKQVALVGHESAIGGLALSPDGNLIYVSEANANALVVIDAKTYQTINTMDLGPNTNPRGVSITPDGTMLYVANSSNNTIDVINTATYEIVATLNTGNFPLTSATTGGTGCSGDPATFTITVKPVPPIIVAKGVLDSLGTIQGNPSVSTKFSVSGTRMQEGIKATAPAGFEISTDNVNFAGTVTFGAAGTIAATTVYVRIAASTAVGNYHGNIILTSLGATNDTVATYKSNNVTEPVSSVVAGFVTGTIAACAGSPSASPNIKQFTASGYLLSADITVKAPAGFEVSVSATGGYSSTLTLTQSGGVVGNTTIYVRSAASATGTISGTVDLSSAGATTQHAAVTGVVSPIPTVDQVPDQIYPGDKPIPAITFTGTANTYNWTNDNTSIGLTAASGYAGIPAFTGINKGGTPLIANITVTPIAASLAYIANNSSNKVTVINTGSNQLVAGVPLPTGANPYGIAISPDGSRVYVTDVGTNSVTVINAISNSIIKNIPVGNRPEGMAISPDGSRLYIANNGTNTVTVISTADYSILATIAVGIAPAGIAVSPDGGQIYVAIQGAATATKRVAVIDAGTLGSPTYFTAGSAPEQVALSPDGATLYVSNYSGASVSVIKVATGAVTTIPTGVNPTGLVVSADGKTLYVAVAATNVVSVVNLATNAITNVPVGKSPQGISLNADGSLLYVNNSAANTISVINTASNAVTTFTTGNEGTPLSYGNFISAGTACPGNPMAFKYVINPSSPYISETGTLAGLSTTYGTASASTNISVSGVSMSAGVTVTPPQGFEVSTDNKTFSATVTLGAAGTIAATKVYIRLAATAPVNTYAGSIITLSSADAADIPVVIPNSTVTAVPLTITADNKSRVAGKDNPVLTATYMGFVNNETSAVLTTQPVLSTTATISSPAGQYPIDVSGAAATNYTFVYLPGVLTINLGEQTISIPNAFTPNGDGINDTWVIPALATYTNFTVSIFNRLGQSLYFSNNYPIPWDGTYHGAPLPTGAYYYIINIKGASKPFSGDVTIIR